MNTTANASVMFEVQGNTEQSWMLCSACWCHLQCHALRFLLHSAGVSDDQVLRTCMQTLALMHGVGPLNLAIADDVFAGALSQDKAAQHTDV